MPDGQLIEFDHVTKRFGAVPAVSDLSATIRPGVVTGFLGPNGAGKTTTLRVLIGLERPTSGTATIGGVRYAELRNPARVIGAMLEDPGFRTRRTVERHLTMAAKAAGIPSSRVNELISFVGLGDDVDTRIAALSLGMRQRLSAATALLGDPGVLVFDEPANGLDPEGIRWMRTLIRGLADEGRTVLVSSHVLSEVEQIADEILIIAHGELKFADTMENLADPRTGPVVVDAPDRAALSAALREAGYGFEILRSGLTVRGSDAATIGAITAAAGVALTTLQQRGPTLEDVFIDLVSGRVAPAIATPAAQTPVAAAPATEAPVAEAPVAEAPTTVMPVAQQTPDVAARVFDVPSPVLDAPPPVFDVPSTDTSEASEAPDAPEALEAPDEPGVPDDADVSDEADAPAEPEAAADAEFALTEDDRPLPGLADLAAVAGMFTDASEPSAAEDLDVAGHGDIPTRVIDAVPSADPGDEHAHH